MNYDVAPVALKPSELTNLEVQLLEYNNGQPSTSTNIADTLVVLVNTFESFKTKQTRFQCKMSYSVNMYHYTQKCRVQIIIRANENSKERIRLLKLLRKG